MKKLFTLLALALASASYAQTNIMNPDFESWSDVRVVDSLEQWWTSSGENAAKGLPILNTTSTSNAYHGNSALHLETVFAYDIFTGDIDTSFGYALLGNPPGGGPGNMPFIYSDTADAMVGYYKCDVMAGDTALILIEMYNAGTAYGQGMMQITGSQSTWTAFSIPIVGGGAMEPDSIFVGFASSNALNNIGVQEGSWLEVDSIALAFGGGSTIPAALPNFSFENFYVETVKQADFWWNMDPHIYPTAGSAYVTQSTNAYSGSYSMEITTTATNQWIGLPSVATNGWYDFFNDSWHGGSEFIAQPDSLVGMYQYSTLLTDTAFAAVTMWNQSTGVLVDTFVALMPAASWTEFSIPLNLTEAPDSMRIVLYSGAELGSELIVDDLDFIGGDLGYDEEPTSNDWSFYPNPANDNVTVKFDEAERVTIIDVSGKMIYRKNVVGTSKVVVNTDFWNDGIYFIQLDANGKQTTKKLIVKH